MADYWAPHPRSSSTTIWKRIRAHLHHDCHLYEHVGRELQRDRYCHRASRPASFGGGWTHGSLTSREGGLPPERMTVSCFSHHVNLNTPWEMQERREQGGPLQCRDEETDELLSKLSGLLVLSLRCIQPQRGSPVLRSKSSNRGSDRSGSRFGSTLRYIIMTERFSYALSSQAKA